MASDWPSMPYSISDARLCSLRKSLSANPNPFIPPKFSACPPPSLFGSPGRQNVAVLKLASLVIPASSPLTHCQPPAGSLLVLVCRKPTHWPSWFLSRLNQPAMRSSFRSVIRARYPFWLS